MSDGGQRISVVNFVLRLLGPGPLMMTGNPNPINLLNK